MDLISLSPPRLKKFSGIHLDKKIHKHKEKDDRINAILHPLRREREREGEKKNEKEDGQIVMVRGDKL